MSAALADGIERDIAPASASAFRTEIAPQLRAAIEVELVPALARGSRVMAREAMLGVNDALQGELGVTVQMAYDEAVARLEGNLDEGRGGAGAFFATIALILGIGLIGVTILWRRETSSSAGDGQAVAMLSAALQRQGTPHSAGDVLDAIQGLDDADQVKVYRYLAEAVHRQGGDKE
jgi:hypothetical protein